jgi:hypothetical protein
LGERFRDNAAILAEVHRVRGIKDILRLLHVLPHHQRMPYGVDRTAVYSNRGRAAMVGSATLESNIAGRGAEDLVAPSGQRRD